MAFSLQPCQIPTLTDLFSPESFAGPTDLRCENLLSFKCTSDSSSGALDSNFDMELFRKNWTGSKNYNRRGFSLKEESVELMNRYDIIKTLKENGNEYTWGNVTVKLAEKFGFYWAVELAIQIAYEARKHLKFLSQHLEEMEVQKIPIEEGKKKFEVVNKGDVVILLAHGATVAEMLVLSDKNVWNTVEKHKKGDYASIIHGKYAHEETVATASFAGKYVIVKNMTEAMYVCDYILGGDLNGSSPTKEEFLKRDLVKVGIANQTIKLKGETEEIRKLVERTMMRKYGVENVNEHFKSFNNICDAIQERQDALYKLIEEKLDLILVIGGWNSSNTSHLQQIANDSGIPSYRIDSEQRIGPGNRIAYKLNGRHGELVEKENFLPKGPLTIGVTAGASNPDKVVKDVLTKVFDIKCEEVLQLV
ncbi:hypothetical protein ACB092_07G142900 [Castanea dentata]